MATRQDGCGSKTLAFFRRDEVLLERGDVVAARAS